jgi:hypothetical protein
LAVPAVPVAGVLALAGAVPGEEHPAAATATVTADSMTEATRNLSKLPAP